MQAKPATGNRLSIITPDKQLIEPSDYNVKGSRGDKLGIKVLKDDIPNSVNPISCEVVLTDDGETKTGYIASTYDRYKKITLVVEIE